MRQYSREKAVDYARKWALSRNPAFYNFDKIGGDCTNFISQCLYAGGGKMNFTRDFGWYYRSANEKSPSWTGVAYLYQFLLSKHRPGFETAKTDAYGMEPGDVIQLSFDGDVFAHSLFVTKTAPGEIYIATHTYDSLDRPLSSYIFRKARFLHIEAPRD